MDRPRHDRAYLLYGDKRNQVLTLDEVHQYGADSFADASCTNHGRDDAGFPPNRVAP
jgi:hypothetical protein